MERDYLSLQEAEDKYSVPRATIRRWLEAGEVKGRQEAKKTRMVWLVDELSLQAYLGRRNGPANENQYQALVDEWERMQRAGTHSRTPLSDNTINANLRGLETYWKCNQLPKGVENIYPDGFRMALEGIPVDEKGCHYSKKRQMYDAIRSFYKHLIRKGLKSKAEHDELAELRPKRKTPAKRTVLYEDKLKKLIEWNESRDWGKKPFDKHLNRILIYTYVLSGLRLSEALSLKISDLDFENGIMTVVGKGSKQRSVPILHELETELREWITLHRPKSKFDLVFLNANGEPLDRWVVGRRMYRLAKKSGVEFTTHGLRRTFTTLTLSRGVSLDVVSDTLGHADMETTKECYALHNKRQVFSEMRKLSLLPDEVKKTVEKKKQEAKLTAEQKAELMRLMAKKLEQ